MTKRWGISIIYYYVIGKCGRNSINKNIQNINKLNLSLQDFLFLNATTLVSEFTLNIRLLTLMEIYNTSFCVSSDKDF